MVVNANFSIPMSPRPSPRPQELPSVGVRGMLGCMSTPALKHPTPDEEALARGEALLHQLHEMGMTDDDIFGAPTDVPHDAVVAWLEGRAACPLP